MASWFFCLPFPSLLTTSESCVWTIPIHGHEWAESRWCWRWEDPGFPCTSLEGGAISVISKPSCWLRNMNFFQQSNISVFIWSPTNSFKHSYGDGCYHSEQTWQKTHVELRCRGWLGLRGCLCRTEPKRAHCRMARAAARAPASEAASRMCCSQKKQPSVQASNFMLTFNKKINRVLNYVIHLC